MTISRGQMKRQLYESGGIMSLSKEGIGGGDYRGIDMGSRTGFGILKKVKNLGKKAVKGVKKIAKSDAGKIALAAAAAYYAPGIGIKAKFGPGIAGLKAAGIAGKSALGNFFLGQPGDTGGRVAGTDLFSRLAKGIGIGGGAKGTGTGSGIFTKGLALAGLSTFLTSQFGMSPEQAEETIANPESRALYLQRYYENLNPNAAPEEVEEFVAANVAEYSTGGRVGFANGPVLPPDTTQPVNPFGPKPGDFGIEDNELPNKKMASYGYYDAMSDSYDMYIDLRNRGVIPMSMSFRDFLQLSQEGGFFE